MTEKDKAAVKAVRKMTDYDLQRIINTKVAQCEESIAATSERHRRDRQHRFRNQYLVAWLAFGLAVLSLITQHFR